MIRKFAMGLLLAGAVAGYGSAFGACKAARTERREAFESHIADVCVGAAERRVKQLEIKVDAP